MEWGVGLVVLLSRQRQPPAPRSPSSQCVSSIAACIPTCLPALLTACLPAPSAPLCLQRRPQAEHRQHPGAAGVAPGADGWQGGHSLPARAQRIPAHRARQGGCGCGCECGCECGCGCVRTPCPFAFLLPCPSPLRTAACPSPSHFPAALPTPPLACLSCRPCLWILAWRRPMAATATCALMTPTRRQRSR